MYYIIARKYPGKMYYCREWILKEDISFINIILRRVLCGDASKINTVHCTLYNVNCSLYTVQCKLYIVNCTLYIVHGTLYSVHYILYNAYNRGIVTTYGTVWVTMVQRILSKRPLHPGIKYTVYSILQSLIWVTINHLSL